MSSYFRLEGDCVGKVWWLVGRVICKLKSIGRYVPVVVVGRGSERGNTNQM